MKSEYQKENEVGIAIFTIIELIFVVLAIILGLSVLL